MRFSASMMKRWMECPKQVHFSDILAYPEMIHAKTVYGTCIHDAFELFNLTGDHKAAVERFKLTWEEPEKHVGQTITVWPTNTTWMELRQRGIDSINKFAEDSKWETKTILGTEHKFVVPFGEHVLSGIVDNIELTGSGRHRELRIIDYKTTARTPTHANLRFDIQFTIYMYASMQPEFWEGIEDGEMWFAKLQDVRRRGIWHSVWNTKTIDVGPRNDLDFMRLYRVCLEIENAVEKEVFVPSIKADSCMWCPYTDVCAVTIPVAHAIQEEKDAWVKR